MQGALVLTPTRQRDWAGCPRRYYLAHLIHLSPPDPDGGEAIGTLVHEELALRHSRTDRHDDSLPIEPDGSADPEVLGFVARHQDLCPGPVARYTGGEVDLRWYVRGKALLLTGRIDALWTHPDGTVEIRDYKTRSCPDDLQDDFAAGLYALIVAAQPSRPSRIRVSYESLGGEHARLVSIDVDRDRLDAAWDAVLHLAHAIRSERDFAPRPSAGCGFCPYRGVCPAGSASA